MAFVINLANQSLWTDLIFGHFDGVAETDRPVTPRRMLPDHELAVPGLQRELCYPHRVAPKAKS